MRSIDVPQFDPADLRAAPAASLTRLGVYEVVACLGRGPIAADYLCRLSGETDRDERYLLRAIHPELGRYRMLVDRVLERAAICARVRHPNVEAIVDLGTMGEYSFVVVKHVESRSLSQMFSLGRDPSPRIAARLIADVLAGLDALHSSRDDRGVRWPIVHGGIAPASIAVGTDGLTRITELGIAAAQSHTTQTTAGLRDDRLGHLAPEQIASSVEADARTDVFAAGTVLWSLLCGQPLFRGDDALSTMHRILHLRPAPPSSVGGNAPFFDAICLRALEKNPDLRFATVAEMASELEEAAVRNRCWADRDEIAAWLKGVAAARSNDAPENPAATTSSVPWAWDAPPGERTTAADAHDHRRARPGRHRLLAWVGVAIGIVTPVVLAAAVIMLSTARPAAVAAPQPRPELQAPERGSSPPAAPELGTPFSEERAPLASASANVAAAVTAAPRSAESPISPASKPRKRTPRPPAADAAPPPSTPPLENDPR